MENRSGSGMIPMFLSGFGERRGNGMDEHDTPLRRLLLVLSGKSPELSSVSRTLAFRLGRRHAAVNLYQIQDQPKDVAAYDGMIMGIAPDGGGQTLKAFAFLRRHMAALSAMPVSLFFLLSAPPVLGEEGGQDLFTGLDRMNPLDVQIFQSGQRGLGRQVADWAGNRVWPMMETAWLADKIFPRPCEADASPEKETAKSPALIF